MEPAKSQPVADIAEQVGGHDTRLWRFIRHYVDEARLYEDYMGVKAIGIDGTAASPWPPAWRSATVGDVTPGGGAHTVERFAEDSMDRNGGPDRARPVTCDMGPGFAEGIRDHLPAAAKIIDRFHVARHVNAILEGLNGIIQHVKTRARGFRNMDCSSP